MSINYFFKKILNRIEYGQVEVHFLNGEVKVFGKSESLKATLEIKNDKAISSIIHEGDIGFGRGYIEEWWTCDNLTNLLIIVTQNIKHIEEVFYGNRLYNIIYKIFDFFKRNTIGNSKKNIEYHYDLGNNFFFQWLDQTKTYSSGLFFRDESLEDAQKNKYQNIIKYLPSKLENILEIGCGWGGFINEVLKYKPDIHIKALTLSHEQFNYVKEQFTENNNIQPVIQDYRKEHDKYDAIVSIEMFEAVGLEYWKAYFDKIYKCLNDEGIAVIQTITIEEKKFDKYLHTSDFIRHFIFPGGILPSVSMFEKLAKESGFKIVTAENFGLSYHKTLIKWLEKFDIAKSEIKNLGFNEKFIRKWRFYLAYCSACFYSKSTDVYQFVLQKHD